MDMQVQGSRPPSARRPQSRINPITGELMNAIPTTARQTPRAGHWADPNDDRNYNVASARGDDRPAGVPRLDLGPIVGKNEEKDFTFDFDAYPHKINTPGTASTISWGTPTSAYQRKKIIAEPIQQSSRERRPVEKVEPPRSQRGHRNQTPKQPTAWDQQPVPENLPGPHQIHKQQYAKYEQEMRDSYRQKSAHGVSESDVRRQIEELKIEIPPIGGADEEDAGCDQLQKTWTSQPYSKAAMLKKSDKEDLEQENRKKKLLETVMIDQLSRYVLSDPQQDEPHSGRPPSYRPGMRRGTVRSLNDSRIQTAGTPTENLLSRRVRFSARVLTRVGRDAIRELTGFFFAVDNSLTIYEFRQFGKSAKALPFIKRGVYTFLKGRQRGESYSLPDMRQGMSLTFETAGQPLPDTMMEAPETVIRVVEVDDRAKADLLLRDVPPAERDAVWRKAHLPNSKEAMAELLLQKEVQEGARRQIRRRGVKVYLGLASLCRSLDEERNGQLNRVELDKALIDYHIDIPQEKFEDLWEALDVDGSSFMGYDVFLRGFLGEMSEDRKSFVRKAFQKIDSSRKGSVSLDEMSKFYNANRHPKVKSGECSEAEILDGFLSHFQHTVARGQVTFGEFETFYEGISVGVEDDGDFVNILRNAWNI